MSSKNHLFNKIRDRYESKRRTLNWKKRKIHNKKIRLIEFYKQLVRSKKGVKNHPAPSDFSLINNTNEVISYFNEIIKFVQDGQPVNIDTSKITSISPDVIILLISILNDKQSRKVGLFGNAPLDPLLNKFFIESGLYDFVNSRGKKVVSAKNKLWKHSTNNYVRGEIAGEAVLVCKKLFEERNIQYDTDNIYNLLVEAMSNTFNHADKNKSSINWWLYYFIDEVEQVIKYAFIDLGIGIFNSASFDSYRKIANYLLPGNGLLVKPFLEGKIVSSRKTDNEISGKGVRQIINCANNNEFINFTIITNDQKINIKEKQGHSLSVNFDGTFIYFEISYKNGNKI